MATKKSDKPAFTAPNGSWDDEFARFPEQPTTLVGTHWANAKKEFWRFEPNGKLSWGMSGGVFSMQWKQRGPWVFVVNEGPARQTEIMGRVDGEVIAGYQRSQSDVSTIEYRRVDGVAIDEYVRDKQLFTAWLVGPRDTPQPTAPPWPPRSAKPAKPAPALRFANHRAARSFAAMTAKEQKHLGAHAATIAEQAEFGGVEAIDLVDGKKVAYHLYWWPFTDGVLIDAKTGAVVADLLDGSLSIADATLRNRVEAGYRADQGSMPTSQSIRFP